MDKNDIIKQQAAIIEALQKENTQLKDTYKKLKLLLKIKSLKLNT